MRPGSCKRLNSAAKISPSATMPASASLKISIIGRKPKSKRPMPAIDPKSPAVGMLRWIQLPKKAVTTLTRPIMKRVAMPTCQVRIASRVATNVGPRTAYAMPMVEGVSSPSGMAVTSRRPVLRARRTASHV